MNDTQNQKPELIATGLNGLVGSKFADLYKDQYSFIKLDLRDPKQPVDITDFDQVIKVVESSNATHLLHLAAFTNVTAAWEQTGDKNGLAYQVNVEGTKNIIKACQETGKHLIHISTAYVFDGSKNEPYIETDQTNPIEWYGQTKLLAEEAVQNSNINWTILRIDQPFREDTFEKTDTAHRIIEGLQNNSLYPQFTNHTFGPTFVNDFSKVADWIIRTNTTGLYHATSGESWSDFDFANAINNSLSLGGEIKKGDVKTYLAETNRPYQINTALNCEKLVSEIDFKLTTIREAIKLIAL